MAADITLPAVVQMHQKLTGMADGAPAEQRLWHLLVQLTRRQLQRDLAEWAPLARESNASSPPLFHEAHHQSAPEAPTVQANDRTYGRTNLTSTPLACRVCGTPFTPDATLTEMRQRLETAGLDAAHLAVCPPCSEVDTSQPAMPGAAITPPATRQPARGRKG